MPIHPTSPRHEDLRAIHINLQELSETLALLAMSEAVRKQIAPISSAFSLCAQVADQLADRLGLLVDAAFKELE